MRFTLQSLLFIAFFPLSAFAAKPVVTAITGASFSTRTPTIQAFGGFAGAICANPNTDLTCDNCVGAGLTACNSTRAYNNLKLRIAASHTETGNLIMVKPGDNTMISTAPHTATNVWASWQAVCQSFPSGTDCETTNVKEGTVRVCLDKDLSNSFTTGEECEDVKIKIVTMPTVTYDIATTSDGISNFVPYPGDEKIYLEDPTPSANFPNLSHGGKITNVRVFVGEGNMTDAVPGSGLSPKDLAIINNGDTLDDSKVDGLENGKPYWFRIGLVDEANNVGYFWPPEGGGASNFRDPNGKNCDVEACIYTATPDQVVGLLTEDMNCFIASAAYGTSLNDKLDTFRELRFKRLLPTQWGRRFVKTYYRYGPFAARYIHDKPVLRAAARGILWPAYGFSRLALRFGLAQAFALSLFAMTLTLALPLIGVRRFFPRA